MNWRDEDRLAQTVSFQRLLACLPRLILRSRTRFSTFLAKSFHTVRSGSCPASAVFPIPVPWTGAFEKQGVPKLNRRRWHQLCFKRGLHICIVALNYVYTGLQPVPVALLGRRPNLAHRAIYARLRALLTACDQPGEHPLPPGRSGPEFIARLVELEHFASS